MSFPQTQTKCTGMLTTRSTQDDASLALLRLPIEIRNMIYKSVLGGMLLHRYWRPGPQHFQWLICRATLSEEDAQRHFDQAKAPAWCVENDARRHADGCYGHANLLHGLDLNLLLACRQVHGEAKHILFSTHTFSFHRCELLQNFLGLDIIPPRFPLVRPIRSHGLEVRNIHLDIRFHRTRDAGSWKMIIPTIAQVLPNLRNINISFDQGAQLARYDPMGPGNIARDDAAQWEALMESLLSLASLPLRSVTFDINDRDIERRWFFDGNRLLPQVLRPYQTELYRWTLEEKQSRARAVREAILKPSS